MKPLNPTAPVTKTPVDVWCIQVIDKNRYVLEEWWVDPNANLTFKFPKHGAKHPFWNKIEPGAKYHLTPFSKLDRTKYLKKGVVQNPPTPE